MRQYWDYIGQVEVGQSGKLIPKPESTERRHVGSLLKKQEGAPLNLG